MSSERIGITDPRKIFLSGEEKFVVNGIPLPYSVKDYWSWSFSDLYNNVYRGILAEYIVATALGIVPPNGNYSREVWNPYDLLSKSGKRVEVKSAAYLQSFNFDNNEQTFSKIMFSIAPALVYDDSAHKYSSDAHRNNDVYVFCHNTAIDWTVSPLDLDYWDFYVLPTAVLNEKVPQQKTITLKALQKFDPRCVKYAQLADAVEQSAT